MNRSACNQGSLKSPRLLGVSRSKVLVLVASVLALTWLIQRTTSANLRLARMMNRVAEYDLKHSFSESLRIKVRDALFKSEAEFSSWGWDPVNFIESLGPQVYPDLRAMAASDPSQSVRNVAIEALSRLKVPESWPILFKAFCSDPSFDVKLRAAQGLVMLDSERAKPLVFKSLESSYLTTTNEWGYTIHLSHLIHKAYPTDAIPFFMRMTDAAVDDQTRAIAVRLLAQLKATNSIPKIRAHVDSRCLRLSRNAILALAELGDREVVPKLLLKLQAEIMQTDTSASSPRPVASNTPKPWGVDNNIGAIVLALGNLGDPIATPHLVQLAPQLISISGPHTLIRALHQIGDARSIPLLISLLNEESYDNNSILFALLNCSPSPAGTDEQNQAHTTENMAISEVETVQLRTRSAHVGLDQLSDSQVTQRFVPLMRNERGMTNLSQATGAVKSALQERRDEFGTLGATVMAFHSLTNSATALTNGLSAPIRWQRLEAFIGLLRLNTREARLAATRMLEDREEELRDFARLSLLHSPVCGFTNMLAARESDYRRCAAQMLSIYKDPSALPALEKALSDSDSSVVDAAGLSIPSLRFLTQPLTSP